MDRKISQFQHVGLSVTDLDLAINFYKNVFGFKELYRPNRQSKSYCDEENKIKRREDIFGKKMREVRIADLLTENRIGLELFEFKEPKAVQRRKNFEYWKTGIFHISFNVSNLEETIEKILKNKGKMISSVWELFPGCKMAYCQDPFRNVFEIISCSYSEMVIEKIEIK